MTDKAETFAAAALGAVGAVLNRDHHNVIRLDDETRTLLNQGLVAILALAKAAGLDQTAVAERAVSMTTEPH